MEGRREKSDKSWPTGAGIQTQWSHRLKFTRPNFEALPACLARSRKSPLPLISGDCNYINPPDGSRLPSIGSIPRKIKFCEISSWQKS